MRALEPVRALPGPAHSPRAAARTRALPRLRRPVRARTRGRPACCELTRVHATGSRPLARERAEAEWLGRQNDMEYGRG